MKPTIITILLAVAALLLMAESEDITILLMSKVLAIAVGYAAVRLASKWESALSNFINAEENE